MMKYDIADVILFDDTRFSKKNIIHKHDRVCRFCGKPNGETTFKKDAHLVSELIGNKELFSDYECDQCNQYFGLEFENELGPFLGISRTLTGSKGKNGIPTFKSPGEKLKAKAHLIADHDTIIISREDPTDDSILVDPATGEMRIKVQKNPFIPLRVYKAFIKMALSLLPGEEVKNYYSLTNRFLMQNQPEVKSGCVLFWYALPIHFNLPFHAFVFKKREPAERLHTHIIALYFQNYIFSIPVLFHKDDSFFYKDDKIQYQQYPPLFTQFTDLTDLKATSFSFDFSSPQKEYSLVEEIIARMSPDDLANSAAYDAATGEIKTTPFNPGNIMQIIIRRDGQPVDPGKLYQAIQNLK